MKLGLSILLGGYNTCYFVCNSQSKMCGKELMGGICSKSPMTTEYEMTLWGLLIIRDVWPTPTSHVLSPFRF